MDTQTEVTSFSTVGGVVSGAIVVHLGQREDKRAARPVREFGDFVDGFIFVQIRACRNFFFHHLLTSLFLRVWNR